MALTQLVPHDEAVPLEPLDGPQPAPDAQDSSPRLQRGHPLDVPEPRRDISPPDLRLEHVIWGLLETTSSRASPKSLLDLLGPLS
eukprot:2741132-Pyramimonas_sp.AAC.1